MKELTSFFYSFNYIFNTEQRNKFIVLAVLFVCLSLIETTVVAMMLPFMNVVMNIDTIESSRFCILITNLFRCSSRSVLIIVIALLLAGLYLIKGLYKIYVFRIQSRLLSRSRAHLSARLFDCIMHKPYSYHLSHTTAEAQRAVTSDVDRLFSLLNAVIIIFAEGCTGLTLFVVLMFFNPMLTAFSVTVIVITLLIINKIIVHKIKEAGEKSWRQDTEMLSWVQQAIGGIKVIYSNRRQQVFVNNYTRSASEFAETNASYYLLSILPRTLTETMSMSSIFFLIALLTTWSNELEEMLPIMATFALAAVRLLPVANRMNDALTEVRYHRSAMNLVYKTLKDSDIDMEQRVEMIRSERPISKTKPLQEGISVEKINFHFENSTEVLYKELSLKIPAGKSVAFVGVTGSGKTTLADIILGLHVPQCGKVIVDGHDIHKDMEWWADQISYIPQFIYLCNDTIRTNITIGIAPEEVDDEQIWNCLADAQLKEFVENLPQRLDTKIGENGVRLSGGQRQRLGIARALYLDPPFLVFDEATSSLDIETEASIMKTINNLAGRKTLLIIAHRLTTIQNCDIIYRIENGRVTID